MIAVCVILFVLGWVFPVKALQKLRQDNFRGGAFWLAMMSLAWGCFILWGPHGALGPWLIVAGVATIVILLFVPKRAVTPQDRQRN